MPHKSSGADEVSRGGKTEIMLVVVPWAIRMMTHSTQKPSELHPVSLANDLNPSNRPVCPAVSPTSGSNRSIVFQ